MVQNGQTAAERAEIRENQVNWVLRVRRGDEAAMDALSSDFTPISDMRASADYRMLVARNLLKRFFIESSGTKKPVTVKRYEVA